MKPEVKIRKTWRFNPETKWHSTRRGKMDYDRKENRRIERNWDNKE